MLAERYASENLVQILTPREAYRPFPTADERGAWESLSGAVRESRLALGEPYLGAEWPALPATLFMEFARNGNRSRYERPHHTRRDMLECLVIAECIEGRGRFLDDIVNGIWEICAETFWGVPAHNNLASRGREPLPDASEPVIDLFAGETAGLLAWTHYLLRPRLDALSPLISERIRREVKRRILDPFLERDDFWWMGFGSNRRVNNWNPWCNSNCITAALLLEEDPDRRTAAVAKAMRSLDRFFAVYHPDGGCDEGPGYWGRAGGSLFDCLELLHGASNGRIDVYGERLVANIGRYLYRAHISGDSFVNFADASALVQIPADLVYRYGGRIGDPKLMALGASAHHARRGRGAARYGSLLRDLPALFGYAEIGAAPADPPYDREAWLDGIEVMTARERQGSTQGLYLAAKGGHNAESHNHTDVGQFIVYVNGSPALIDVGVETYTAQTFSSRRYEIWTMQSAYHNLPTVNGVTQQAGREFQAREVAHRADESQTELSLDIAAAYPAKAGILSWKRFVRLMRGAAPCVEVVDTFELEKATEDVTLSLMTPREPGIDALGIIHLAGTGNDAGVRIEFDAAQLTAASERIPVEDARLRGVWGDHLFRVLLRAQAPVERGTWRLQVRGFEGDS